MEFVGELEGVSKRFGKVVALDNVDLGLKGKVSDDHLELFVREIKKGDVREISPL